MKCKYPLLGCIMNIERMKFNNNNSKEYSKQDAKIMRRYFECGMCNKK
jgi:hypothetical protein